jgi:hypothetical protein
MPTDEGRDSTSRKRRAVRILVLLVLTTVLSLRLWNGDGTRQGLRVQAAFAAQVWAHFDEWDLDHDGVLTSREVAALVPCARIRGEAAAALAAIHQVQRSHHPRWSNAAFGRFELIGGGLVALLGIESPPFSFCYASCLAHVRAAGRTLFADGAPALGGIHQGQSGDCFLIATAGALAARGPNELRAMFVAERDGGFTVRFPGGAAVRVPSISDAEIALGSTAGGQGVWINVLEKAFGQIVADRRGSLKPAVDELTRSGTPTQTIALLTGHTGYWFGFRALGSPMGLPRERLGVLLPEARTILGAAQPPRWLTTCETTSTAAPPGMIPSHVYAVLAFDPGNEIVHLWNPLGNDFTPGGPAGIETGYRVRDGHFSVPLADFLQIFVAMTYESGLRGRG